jgi:hypothetical protein
MHAAHAELASLAGTDGEVIPVTSWTTVKATSCFWENFFRKAANCQHQNQWSASTGNDVARISRSYEA